MGEGCSPPAGQSVYYSSSLPSSYTNVPYSTPLSALTVSPFTTIAAGTSATINASGGTPPYYYSVLTSGGGIFSGNIYTAPSNAMLTQLEVRDSAGQSQLLAVTVTASTTPGTTGTATTYDVFTTPVCSNGYCACLNQTSAQAICTAYGRGALTAYQITNGPVGYKMCDPATGQCFTNQNPNNYACVTVTCL